MTKFNENTHNCQRITIKSIPGKKIQDFFIDTSSILPGKIYMNENKFLMLTSFFHSKVLGTPRKIFQRYHPGLFKMQNPICDCVLKPEGRGGVSKPNI